METETTNVWKDMEKDDVSPGAGEGIAGESRAFAA